MGRRSLLRSFARRLGYDLRRRSDLVQQADPFEAKAVLRAEHPVQRIVDVGAHEGRTVARYRALFPEATIDAFEPYGPSADALEARVAGQPKATVHRVALGDVDGTLTLHVNRATDTSSALPFSQNARRWMPDDLAAPARQLQVPQARLDTYCRVAGIDHIDILKLDVQGYECAVLRGAGDLLSRGVIDLVFCEIEFVSVYEGQPLAHEVTSLLADCGYTLYRYYELVYAPNGQLLWGDGLYLSPAARDRLPDQGRGFHQAKTQA